MHKLCICYSAYNFLERSILTLNEINVNLFDKSVRNIYKKAYHTKHRRCSVQASWAPTTITAIKYRPGGTQVTLFGGIVHRSEDKNFDKICGSWSSTTVKTKKGPLTKIPAYRVSQSALGNLSPKTIYSQDYMALEANGVRNPEPRKRCLLELSRVIEDLQTKQYMVLLNLDANECLISNKDLLNFQQDNGLIDLVAQMSPHQEKLPTYCRGKKRIDYSFGSLNLLEYVKRAYITRTGITESDHSAITIILDRSKLL